jgi:glycosyltransferase involved in cell wall biosynthesis
MNDKKILYIFGPGRLEKIKNENIQAKEFFYGYFHLNNKYNLNAIGATKSPSNIKGVRKLLHFYDRVIVKFTNFPSYTTEIITINNIKNYSKREVFTSDALFISFLPVVFFYKLIGKKINNIVITMGLLGKPNESKFKYITNNLFLKLLYFSINKFVFLGKGEYDLAKKIYGKNNTKIYYMPFAVDTEFWSEDSPSEKEGILFVGNDGKRDYQLLVELVKEMKDLQFTFISDFKFNYSAKNLNIIQGNWHEQLLSDDELRNFYMNAKLTILPIKETFQPSGQSVGLQSISCKTPILVSKTKGFWGDENFANKYKVNFVNNNNVEEWSAAINNINNFYKRYELSNEDTFNFHNEYNLENFAQNLERLF